MELKMIGRQTMIKLFFNLMIFGVMAMVTVSTSAEQNKQTGTSVIGLKFPTLTTDSLAGTKVTLPDSAKGKVTLVIMSFKRDSQSQNDSWLGPFEKEFGQKDGYLFYEVPMIRRRFVFMAPLIDSGMRAAIPNEKHKNVITFYGNVDPYKQALKIEDIYLGYAYLLDREGIIRWQRQGLAKAEDIKALIETAQGLTNKK
jgi:hypothetical protein